MQDFIELSATPVGEKCEQVGPNCDYVRMKMECRAFIGQLRRQFGDEPLGAKLAMKSFPHDFGSYYEVVCHFNDDFDVAIDYAYNLENNLPEHWDETAKAELGLNKPTVENPLAWDNLTEQWRDEIRSQISWYDPANSHRMWAWVASVNKWIGYGC